MTRNTNFKWFTHFSKAAFAQDFEEVELNSGVLAHDNWGRPWGGDVGVIPHLLVCFFITFIALLLILILRLILNTTTITKGIIREQEKKTSKINMQASL